MKNFYSYSKISCYDGCPLQYSLTYRQQIKLPRVYAFEAVKGNIFHRYAEVYRGDRREALDIAMRATDEGVTQEFLDLMTKEQKQLAAEYTRQYDELWKSKLSNISAEHEVKLFYEEEPYQHDTTRTFAFTGYIDNLLNENGKYTIVDYKTAKKVNPSLYKKQIQLYAYFLSKLRGIPLKDICGAIFFPCAEDATELKDRWKSVEVTEASVAKTVEWMHEIIKEIETEPFNTDAKLQFLCRWCSYAGLEEHCVTSVIAGLRKS